MKTCFALLLFVGLFWASASDVLGCRCAPPKTAQKAFKQAAVVFVGKVTELTFDKRAKTYKAVLSVETAWKGVSTGEVFILGTTECCVCSYDFELGETYLVYGTFTGKSNAVSTSTCTRTNKLAKAAADVKVLGNSKTPPPRT